MQLGDFVKNIRHIAEREVERRKSREKDKQRLKKKALPSRKAALAKGVKEGVRNSKLAFLKEGSK